MSSKFRNNYNNSSNDSKKKRFKKNINKNCSEQFQSALKLRKSVGLQEERAITVRDTKLYEKTRYSHCGH